MATLNWCFQGSFRIGCWTVVADQVVLRSGHSGQQTRPTRETLGSAVWWVEGQVDVSQTASLPLHLSGSCRKDQSLGGRS